MKALVLVETGKVRMEDRNKPIAKDDEVLIRVRASGICGSEVEGFLGKSDKRVPPLIMGHELTGDVTESGLAEDDSLIGQRVVVQPVISCGKCEQCIEGNITRCATRGLIGINRPGGFAEYVAVPRSSVYPLPEGLDYAGGTLTEPLAVIVRAFNQNQKGLIRWVSIFGAGTLGALALQIAKLVGAETIISDVNPLRLEAAKQLGAETVIRAHQEDPVQGALDATGGRGVDMAIDAVGQAITRQQCLASLKNGGVAVFIGLGKDHAVTPLNCLDIVNKELRITGSYAYSNWEFTQALNFLERQKIKRTGWVEEIPLEDGPKAFENLAAGASRAAKIVLMP